MPVDPQKRQLRELKRTLKKAGGKRARRELKRTLAENPEEAAEAEVDFGRFRSADFNGMDKDSTRKRKEDERS